MRLSNAIALGRTTIIPTRLLILQDATHGCALGMGLSGSGADCEFIHQAQANGISLAAYKAVHIKWPWLGKQIEFPCNCEIAKCDDEGDGVMAIGHLFDYHVSIKRDWTLDQLIDWIRSVEPEEVEVTDRDKETIPVPVEIHPH